MKLVGGTDVGDEEDERAIWEIEDRVRKLLTQALSQGFAEVVIIGSKLDEGGYDVWSTWDSAEATLGAVEFGKARVLKTTEEVLTWDEKD